MNMFSFALSNVKNDVMKWLSVKTGRAFSKPYQITIEPNERCNARCLMCDCWKETQDYISSDEILTVLKELRGWIGPNFFVQIAGGEPLIYPGIYDIFRYCADHQIICKISSNGISLNSESVCQKIIESGLKYLTVSIDSHKAEIHDKYRGVPGAFDKAIKGLKYLDEHSDMVLGVSCIIMKENVDHLKEFTDFLLSLPVGRILFQPVRAYKMKISEWHTHPMWIDDHKKLEEGIAYIKKRKKEDPRIMNTVDHLDTMVNYFKDPKSILNSQHCHIGYEQLNITYKGDVFLCDAYGKLGNIKEGSVKAMWKSEHARKVRKKMVTCKLPCTSNCKKELTFWQKVQKFMVFFKAGMFK